VGKTLRDRLAAEGVKLQMVVETLIKGWLTHAIDLPEVRRKIMEAEAKGDAPKE